MIDGQNIFDQPVRNNLTTYDYLTCCLLGL